LTGPIVQSVYATAAAGLSDRRPPSGSTSPMRATKWPPSKTDIGLIPNMKVTLQIVREPSEADRTALQRHLLIGRSARPRDHSGLSRGASFTLFWRLRYRAKMRVSKNWWISFFFPLPSADFTMTPAGGPAEARETSCPGSRAARAKAGQE